MSGLVNSREQAFTLIESWAEQGSMSVMAIFQQLRIRMVVFGENP
jgi:hypothetical protein